MEQVLFKYSKPYRQEAQVPFTCSIQLSTFVELFTPKTKSLIPKKLDDPFMEIVALTLL